MKANNLDRKNISIYCEIFYGKRQKMDNINFMVQPQAVNLIDIHTMLLSRKRQGNK